MNDDPILRLEHVTKAFPGVVALKDVSMTIQRGEVHILVGQNGAGKSSLVKLLTGIYFPDGGEMFFEGEPYAPKSTFDAFQKGIRVVHQEFNLLPYLSIAENIFLERLPANHGFVDYGKLYRDAEEALRLVGFDIDPRTRVEMLGVAQMQLVEIAKAVYHNSKVLIMDEPTATLTSKEIQTLFGLIKTLKQRGVTIIYISHRLQEIYEIGDRVTVLRNGEYVTTEPLASLTINDLVKLMVGRDIGVVYPFDSDVTLGDEVLKVEDLQVQGGKHRVSFSVRSGEILGISGLVGSGRTETVRALFGADQPAAGQIYLHGQPVQIRSPKDAVRYGLSLLTEDRKSQGVILNMNIAVNMTLADLAKVSKNGFLQQQTEAKEANRLVEETGTKTPSVEQIVRNLSGGNQQKVVLGKWLFCDAELLIFDEPTRGIDVGARYEIYLLLWKLARMGKAIIVVSSDLDELIGISHRILVFSDGKITGELTRDAFDQEKILSYAYEEYIR